MTAQMSAAVTADILITGSLLYYLKKSKVTGTHRLRYLFHYDNGSVNVLINPLQDQLADQPVDCVDGKYGASYRVSTSLRKCNSSGASYGDVTGLWKRRK